MPLAIEYHKTMTEHVYINLPGPTEPTSAMSGGELLHGFLSDLYKAENATVKQCINELCLKWNLPKRLANAIRHHHNPEASGGNKLAYILNLANFLAKPEEKTREDEIEKVKMSLVYLGFSRQDIPSLKEEATNAVEALEEDTYTY